MRLPLAGTDKGVQSDQERPGRTRQSRDRKINQLAAVTAAMNTGRGPDLLGVREVENRFVVDRLVDRVNAILPAPRSYAVVLRRHRRARGSDVAFIYNDTLLQVSVPLEESVFLHVVMRRHATREIVQVNFKKHNGGCPDLGRLRGSSALQR
jgi:hypothetical protein